MSSLPKIPQFNPDEISFDMYLVMFEANLSTYEITDSDKKRNFLIVSLGTKVFSMLCNLSAPSLPNEKSYDELVALLKKHYITKPSYHRSLCLFQQRKKVQGETLKELYADLKRLAKDCNFGNTFDSRLRDQLFMAIDNLPYFKYLMAEDLNLDGLSSNELLDRIHTLEKAHVGESETAKSINKLVLSDSSVKCSHCGYPHKSFACKFKSLNCNNCGKLGHLQRVCRAPKQTDERKDKMANQNFKKSKGKNFSNASSRTNKNSVKHVDQEENSNNEKSSGDEDLWKITTSEKVNSIKPEIHKFNLKGVEVPLEIDCGAGVSLLSKNWFKKFDLSLQTASKKIFAYGNMTVKLLGEVIIPVKYNNRNADQKFFITDTIDNNICGRDLMHKMGFYIQGLDNNNRVDSIHDDIDINSLLKNYEIDCNKPVNGFVAKIYLKDNAIPKVHKARQVPFTYKPLVDEALKDLLDKDIIEPIVHSDWASPIVPVLKKNGKIRICADFKYLNSQLNIEKYPLPKLEEMLSVVGDNKVFSKLDLENAYLQVPINDDENLLVISTQQGLYRFKRLPYGLASAPGIFQRYISQLLNKFDDVVMYLDDILVVSKNIEDHKLRLKQVLEVLQKANVKLNEKKCDLFKTSLDFLGFVLSEKGFSPSPDKIKAILEAPEPTNLNELKSFIGLVTYYNRFVPNFSTVLAPLYDLTKNSNKFVWSSNCKKSFQSIKELLSNSNLLTTFNGYSKLILETDASPVGVGAVLLQCENGLERPVAFASKKLSSAELNYSQIDKEALSIVYGVTKFKYYLLGRNFELRTDHKPLLGLFGKSKCIPVNANARIQRWSIILSQYSYDLYHKPGKNNVVADMLSRLPIEDKDKSTTPIEYVKLMNSIELFDFSFKNIQSEYSKDQDLKILTKYLKFGWVKGSNECKEYSSFKNDLSIYNGVILYNNRILIPPKLRDSVLSVLHSGHCGIVAMKAEARISVWWPSINSEIEELTKSCDLCCKNFKSSKPQTLSWTFPSRPWSRVHIDYCGPIEGKQFLILVDPYTKFIDVHYTSTTTSSKTIELLRKSFANFGIPDTIVSDNAPYFVSEEIKHFYKKNGIKLINPAPYNPSSNGMAERAVRTFKEGMQKFKDDSLNTRVTRFLYNYRRTIHSITNKSPSELMFNRQFKSPLSMCKPDLVREEEDKILDKSKNFLSTKKCENSFELNQAVYVKNFGIGSKWVAGEIIEVLGCRNYYINIFDHGNIKVKRHASQIMPRYNLNMTENKSLDNDSISNNQYKSKDKDHEYNPSSFVDIPLPTSNPNTLPARLDNDDSSSSPQQVVLRKSARVSKPPDRLNL